MRKREREGMGVPHFIAFAFLVNGFHFLLQLFIIKGLQLFKTLSQVHGRRVGPRSDLLLHHVLEASLRGRKLVGTPSLILSSAEHP